MIMQPSTNKTNSQNTKLTKPVRTRYIATARTPLGVACRVHREPHAQSYAR